MAAKKKAARKKPAGKKAARKKTARKAAPRRPNVETLAAAGVIDPNQTSAEHQAAINKLSPAEVKALLSVHKKVGKHLDQPGAEGAAASGAGRPWML